MQAEKCTTLENILSAAKDEFFLKDYPNASLREISKKAGVTTGAFYGYFKTKAEILDALVGTEYQYMIDYYKTLLSDFAKIPPEEQIGKMMEISVQGVNGMVDYVYDHISAFQLMLCHAQGTKYADLVHQMAMLDMEATHQFVQSANEIGGSVQDADDIIEHIITTGMFSALFELIIHNVPKEKAKEYAITLMRFYHAGFKEILGF